MELLPATDLGKYVVVRPLGSGGMGVVFLARHTDLGSLHAVKLLRHASPAVDARLMQEGRLQATLSHPNVIRVTDTIDLRGRTASGLGRTALVMEFVEGPTLAEFLASGPALSIAEIDLLARGILKGVGAAHDRGWVHRDLKPGNVLLQVTDGEIVPKVSDFGLAKVLEGNDPGAVEVGSTSRQGVGTRRYMPLEQLAGLQPDPRVDVFALGAILYELCLGRPAFPSVEAWEAAIRADTYPSVDRADLPDRMREAVRASLAPRDRRVPTARELLRTWIGEAADAAPAFRGETVRLARPPEAHVDAGRLLSGDLSPSEEAHLARCGRCRSEARRVREFQEELGTSTGAAAGPDGHDRTPLPANADVGPYRIVGRLGEGGLAVVYLARHVELRTWHAVKVPTTNRPEMRERLRIEGRIQAALRHANIVAVTDVVDLPGSAALVLEYVRGPTLEQVLGSGRLDVDALDELARGVLAGVREAHRAGLVHRDLKPANILCTREGDRLVPKVADFGIAKVFGETGARTRTGAALGTPLYMAPEQMQDAKSVDHRADVWSLGAILYEMATGARAFERPDVVQVMAAVANGRRAPVEELAPGLPARMARAIESALVVDPGVRSPSVDALYATWTEDGTAPEPPSSPARWSRITLPPPPEELAATLTRPPVVAEPLSTMPPISLVQPRTARRALPVALGIAGLAGLAALAVPFAWRDRPDADPGPAPVPVAAAPAPIPAPPPVAEPPPPAEVVAVAPRPRPVASPEPVPVWVRTRPYGTVAVGGRTWDTEDPAMRLPPGRTTLRLASHDGRFAQDWKVEVKAGAENRFCWDFERGAKCSSP